MSSNKDDVFSRFTPEGLKSSGVFNQGGDGGAKESPVSQHGGDSVTKRGNENSNSRPVISSSTVKTGSDQTSAPLSTLKDKIGSLKRSIEDNDNARDSASSLFPKIQEDNFSFLYRELIGRSPTQSEVQMGIHLSDVLRLSDSDPLWPILLTYMAQNSVQKEHHVQLENLLSQSERLLAKFKDEAESIRFDHCLLPEGLRKKSPVWLQTIFSFSTLKYGVVACALYMSMFAFFKQKHVDEFIDNNGGLSRLTSCYYGEGTLTRIDADLVKCTPTKERDQYLILKRPE